MDDRGLELFMRFSPTSLILYSFPDTYYIDTISTDIICIELQLWVRMSDC